MASSTVYVRLADIDEAREVLDAAYAVAAAAMPFRAQSSQLHLALHRLEAATERVGAVSEDDDGQHLGDDSE